MAARPAGLVDEQPYWILRKDQITCLASPARQDILDHLSSGGVMSVKELASAVGRKPSAVYHHIKLLLATDLICDAGSRIVNRRHERLFRTPSRRMRMLRALADPQNREQIKELVAATARQSVRDLHCALDRDGVLTEGEQRNLGVFRLVNTPGEKSLREINRRLDEIAEILWADSENGDQRIALAWTMAPLPDPEAP